eukprot:scaffold8460_cov166-Amphora_coffeaeformis.AAC.5
MGGIRHPQGFVRIVVVLILIVAAAAAAAAAVAVAKEDYVVAFAVAAIAVMATMNDDGTIQRFPCGAPTGGSTRKRWILFPNVVW